MADLVSMAQDFTHMPGAAGELAARLGSAEHPPSPWSLRSSSSGLYRMFVTILHGSSGLQSKCPRKHEVEAASLGRIRVRVRVRPM